MLGFVSKQIKNMLENIEIPKELRERTISGVNQAKHEMSKVTTLRREKNKMNKFKIVAAAVAVIVIGGALSIGGNSNLVNAGQTLINQIFGSEEKIKKVDPVATTEDIHQLELNLGIAKRVLTNEEFATYSELLIEMGQLVEKMNVMESGVKKQNLDLLTKDEQKRLEQLQAEIQPFEKTISKETTLTFEEAAKLANYPIQYPTFVPEGYVLDRIEAETEEGNPTGNPMVHMDYKKGEFGFRMITASLKKGEEDEITRRSFKNIDSYSHKEYDIDYVYSDDSKVSGMRLSIPSNNSHEAYKILIIADILSKEEMERIILSAVQHSSNN